jgi:hypothetical protein
MTTAKPSTRKTPTKAAEPKSSLVDQMGEDAAAPAEYPVGAPEFRPLLDVRPRGRRAEFKRVLAQIAEQSPALRAGQAVVEKIKADGEREAAMFRLSADMDELFELVESALRLVAVDPAKFDAWAAQANDEDLQTTWAVYQSEGQPGEASSSSS